MENNSKEKPANAGFSYTRGQKLKGLFYLMPVGAGILFGSAGTFIRILSANDFNTVTIVAQRASVATIILAIIILLYDKKLFKIRLKDIWIFALTGICGITVMNLCYNIAMQKLTMSFAAVLLSIFPVFVFMLSSVLFKERITKRKILCSCIAIAGCYMVSDIPGIIGVVNISGYGIVMGIIAPLFYSLYSIGSRLAVERGYQAMTITFYSIFIMALVSLPFADWKTVMMYALENPNVNLTVMITHAVCVAVLPYMLFTIGIQHIDSGTASMLSSCEPAAAMVFGAFIFNEIPSVISVVGLFVTTVAMCIICMPEKEPPISLI